VEKGPRKLEKDPYIPPKPSHHSPSSLSHMIHHQKKLAFTLSHKKDKKKKIVILFIYMHSSRIFYVLICIPTTIGLHTC